MIAAAEGIKDFYPRPPGGGRPAGPARITLSTAISIHALRVEGDVDFAYVSNGGFAFLSTPSGWRATSSAPHPPET